MHQSDYFQEVVEVLVAQFELGPHQRAGQDVLSFLLKSDEKSGQIPEEVEHGQMRRALRGHVQVEDQEVGDFRESHRSLEKNEEEVLQVLVGVVEGDEEVLVSSPLRCGCGFSPAGSPVPWRSAGPRDRNRVQAGRTGPNPPGSTGCFGADTWSETLPPSPNGKS